LNQVVTEDTTQTSHSNTMLFCSRSMNFNIHSVLILQMTIIFNWSKANKCTFSLYRCIWYYHFSNVKTLSMVSNLYLPGTIQLMALVTL